MGNTDILIEDLDEATLGPAMKRCTLMQRRFVMAVLILGGRNMRRAAMMAGYSGTDQTLAVTGFRTAHIDYVQDALREEGQKRLTASSIDAMSTVMGMASGDITAPPSVRFAASLAVLDRTGFNAKTEHSVTVTTDVGKHTVLLEMIRARLKHDPTYITSVPEPIRLMLAAAAEPVDVPFVEVNTPPDLSEDDDLSDLVGEE